ncbi:ATP-binding protein [Flavobacterium beibuense]|uniref:histidine kinase n=1 Tax=Flavobacterium beibuense TaxID=657326 RepID=A0A444WHT0_9FLAO|nr:ATP-binding protein [Flavobacterium beibuense]RYJ45411.1 two-component system sensor histidine kinase/response regulator hybrid [Flavobacterium beibuense]
MAHQTKSVKYKVITGYLLLFIFAVLAVWFVYTEISKAASKNITGNDNTKVIQISNVITNLYASEALGRTAMLTGEESDYNIYSKLIDSIGKDIDILKQEADPAQTAKFDSIQLLINQKRISVNSIIKYRNTNNPQNLYEKGKEQIKETKESLVSKAKPLKPEERYEWSKVVNAALTPKMLDSIRKFASNDSLTIAYNKVVNKMINDDLAQRRKLNQKEQILLEENRIITEQLRVILSSVENEILQKSYRKITDSQAAISSTLDKMAWIGGAALLIIILFAWIIINDLTKSQEYRTQLELLNTENEKLLRSKTMLMATVTHDLQTPLGSIIGFSDLIDNSDINPKQKQYLQNIKESADYILKLVSDLVDFSKLENNRITIEDSSFNLKTLIENTCRTLEHSAENKSIELNWDVEDDLDTTIISDPYRIKQVLTNLISNAIKFTNEGSVEVTAVKKNESIQICVVDTGIGIAKESQSNVFKEFTQANPGIEKKFGGTGLGLTISRRIIELLGGTIDLESEEGKGSVFTIIIPYIKGIRSTIDTTNEEDTSYSYIKDKKILLVDDDKTQLSLLKEVFTDKKAIVTIEINALAVPDIVTKSNFDIILTDIQMPGIDGFELLERLQESDFNLPIIALSGRKDLTDEYFKEKGFTAFHAKPVNVNQLLALVSNIFGDNKIIHKETQEIENLNRPLYDLKSLSQFTQNDPESLKMIIETFIQSSIENCTHLNEALSEMNEQKVIEVSHKMIPMLKQIEAFHISEVLDTLEERHYSGDWNKIQLQIYNVCNSIDVLLEKLRTEIA